MNCLGPVYQNTMRYQPYVDQVTHLRVSQPAGSVPSVHE
jgi:hypothetical protein